jgi:two-component sensor histidine kinase
MRTYIPGIGSQHKHKIDFSLIPLGVILVEFSAFATQLSKDVYGSFRGLIGLHVLHALVMLLSVALLSQVLIKLKRTELNYRTIAITGTLIIALGDVINRYIGPIFDVELVDFNRRIGIVLLQGCLWFPAFIIVGGKRTEIFEHFRAYEERLIIATRARSRNSDEFTEIRRDIQDRIRIELYASCKALKESIALTDLAQGNLANNNAAIQPHLLGEDLRKLSMSLETFGSEHVGKKFLGQNINSVTLLIRQFRILYSTTVWHNPLHSMTYVIVLMALVTPAYINYFPVTETLISYPLLAITVLIFSRLITRTQAGHSPNSLRNSSILIYLTGLLPLLFNVVGQTITQDARTDFPVYILALTFPISYYIFMKVLQVLQPRALDLIQSDELKASVSLQHAVTRIVSEEFSHTLSHRWAIFIHGKILTRLAATALKLETASNAGDTQTFNEAVNSLLALLSAPDSEFEQAPTDLQTEVSSRLDPWLGLLDVELEIDSELKTIRNSRVRDLGEVIEELISNSMRHGKAQSIHLKMTRVGERDIQITARDNAPTAPPEIQTRYGLGTRIFNLASDGRWSIMRVESGTEFKLTMAIEI